MDQVVRLFFTSAVMGLGLGFGCLLLAAVVLLMTSITIAVMESRQERKR